MKSGIYVWKLNGVPKYVGQGLDVQKRMVHRHYNSGALTNAINKYGFDAFEKEIILFCDPDELNEKETYYIKKLKTHTSQGGYNILKEGFSRRGVPHREDVKKRISDALKGEKSPRFGKHHTPQAREKISKARTGKYVGEKNVMWGKTHSVDARKKISDSKKDLSDETRRNMSLAQSGKNNYGFGKKVKGSSSEFFGVSKRKRWYGTYWEATLKIAGKQISMGCFKDERLAAQAYNDYVIANGLDRPLNQL